LALEPVERAELIDAVDVIGVIVGVDHAIQPADIGVEQLLAEIGGGIDKHRRLALRDQDRGPPAPIAGVFGVARPPPAADHRHAPCPAAAEDGDAHVLQSPSPNAPAV
jgi:hypothetical protein